MITSDEWGQIARLIRRELGQGEVFITRVTLADENNAAVYTEMFGQTPVRCAAFRETVKYYDGSTGATVKRSTPTFELPQVGEVVVVVAPGGDRQRPICLGVLLPVQAFYE